MNLRVVPYRYTGKNTNITRTKGFRVLDGVTPIVIEGESLWNTRDEAETAMKMHRNRLTMLCPKCQNNMIEHHAGMGYIDNLPSLKCFCGTWVNVNNGIRPEIER